MTRETTGQGAAGPERGRPGRPVPPPQVPGSAPGAGAGSPAAAPAAPPRPPEADGWGSPPPLPGPLWSETGRTGPGWPDPDDPSAPETRGPLRRRAAWGWTQGLMGLAVGFGPELLLYAASLGVASSEASGGSVTTGSAIALVVVSLVIYGWQTAAAWFFSVRIAGRRFSAWGFRLPTRAYFWTIPAALAVVYLVSIGHDMLIHPKQQELISEFPHSAAGTVLFVLLAVVIAPLFEEVFFRGFLFRGFASSWGWVAGAVVSSAVFGIAHAQVDVFIPLFALGLMLAWVYQRTGSLWTSISLHALFNGVSVLAWALTG